MTSWRNIITEPDNVTLCPVKIVMLAAGVIYHGLIGFAVGFQHLVLSFDMMGEYLQHMTILGVAFGAAVGAKSLMKGDSPPST